MDQPNSSEEQHRPGITNGDEDMHELDGLGEEEDEPVFQTVRSGESVAEMYGENEEEIMHYKWENRLYGDVLSLLIADYQFPREFNMNQLSDDNEDEKKLKRFVEERSWFHDLISNGNLKEIQMFVSKSKSKYYLSKENESACYCALKNKKFEIYSYLKSVGAEFLNDKEKSILWLLDFKDRVALADANVIYFPSVSDGHIFYLMSKSKSQKPVDELGDKVKDFYSELDKIPELSVILQVIQYSDYLDIVFDFDEENVATVNPMSSSFTKGEAQYKTGRLYIAACPLRGERKILGTLIHELTHMAMELLFENECNPYRSSDSDIANYFKGIVYSSFDVVRSFSANDPSHIIRNVANEYPKVDHHSELIVTVPQILIGCENGKEWLEKYVPNLLHFYTSIIIPKCKEFISKSRFLKSTAAVRKLNESVGEIIKLRKSDIFFKDVDRFKRFLEREDKNIFVFITENVHLGMIKLLQGKYGLNYLVDFDKYLALGFENLMSQLKEICRIFYSASCDTLVIQFNKNSDIERLEQFFEIVTELFENKPGKKIVIVIYPQMEKKMQKVFEDFELWDVSTIGKDTSFSLCHFDQNSQKAILSKNIRFQGMKTMLKSFIGMDEKCHSLITEDIIENLIQEKEVDIGDQMYSNFGETYNCVNEEIDAETFLHEVVSSEDIFVIQGLIEKERLIAYFNGHINEQEFLGHEWKLLDEIQINNSVSAGSTKKRLLLNDRLSDEDINSFCQNNRDKKIYFIVMKESDVGITFVLQKFYKPNFYLKRKFKVTINPDQIENLISKFPNENFIISKNENLDDFKLKKDHLNVRMLKMTDAKSVFNDFRIEHETVHWFHAHSSEEIYWKDSSGFTSDPWLDFKSLKTNDEYLIEEADVISHLTRKKIFIISDNSGMGKSATLSKLFQQIAKNHWVIRINLKDHVEHIKIIDPDNFKMMHLIELLQKIKPYLKDKLAKNLFQIALERRTTFPEYLLFAFDGFDDILEEENRERVIGLLKYLQTIPNSKIWITTHFLYKTKLENELSTFAFKFDPLDEEKKIDFIMEYLKNHIPKLIFRLDSTFEIFDSENSKIRIYAEKFLEYIKTNFNKDLVSFIDTPSQLNLMMENSLEHFINWAKGKDENPDFTHLGKNFMEIYEKFNDRKSEINYLISKSKSRKGMKGLKDIVNHYYSKLGEIPEISPILKVVQYSDFLDIEFDFEEECTRDETRYREGKLYIAANPNRGEKKILGSIAYKLARLAMEIVFENECKPYRRSDGDLAKEFENVNKQTMENIKNNSTQFKEDIETTVGKVAQILAGDKGGLDKEIYSAMIDFYTDKIIPKCREFISQSNIMKPRNAIRKLNETLGEIMKLRKLNIAFKDVDSIKDFLEDENKKIFILKTENPYMGLIKILQTMFGPKYIDEFDKYLAFSFENLMSQLKEILQAFHPDASDTLIVRFNHFVDREKLKAFVNEIPDILKQKQKKKIVFIVHSNVEDDVRMILRRKKLMDICAEENDACLTLYDLNEESKKMILSKDVVFQGMKIILKDLIGTNKKLQKLLAEDTLEELFEEKEVCIGSKTYEHFNFERARSQVNEEIEMNTFMNELKSPDDIFVIKGSDDLNNKQHLLTFFEKNVDKNLFDLETIAGQFRQISSVNFEIDNKRLLLRDRYSDIDIKKFCENNRDKKVCFIDVKRVENKIKLVLKEFYNPSFYLDRKFKTLQINQNVLEDWISKLEQETFILSQENSMNDFKLQKNVQISDCDNAHIIFNDCVKNKETAHWFHVQDCNKICWMDSSGSIEKLRILIQTLTVLESKNILPLMDEKDVIEHLVHKKVLIIADEPGMGKSTTLTKLYDSPLIAQTHWVIRIDLEKHIQLINKIQLSNFNLERVIKILQKMNSYLKDKLTEDLLKSALVEKTFSKCLLLAFDGFDEVKHKADRNKIVFFLKYLQRSTKSKIWVTTRFEHKNELENNLCSIALEFEPIDDENRKKFMERYLKDRLKLTLDAELAKEIFVDENEKSSKIRKIYIENFFEYMRTIFAEDLPKYMGAPYQLNLIFEKCLNHCKKWIESKNWVGNNDEILDFSFLGKDKVEVLEKNSDWELNQV